MDKPVTPRGINHLVLNVRDIEESHRFWTEIVGFEQVGQLTPTADAAQPAQDALLLGHPRGRHAAITTTSRWSRTRTCRSRRRTGRCSACRSRSTTSPSPCRAARPGCEHLAYLQKKGVKFDRRVEHGMTHSLYIHDPNGYGVEFVYDLPKEVWKDDINAALNFVKVLPTEGAEALDDRVEGVPIFKQPAPAK